MRDFSFTIGAAIFASLVTLLFCSIGFSYLVDGSKENLEKTVVPFLTMVGSWVAGVGAIFAAVVALRIANNQIKHEYQQGAIRCIHHSLTIINDLRGRLQSIKLMLKNGGQPLIALTKNAEMIQTRYESLYSQEIYRYIPGEAADLISSMSGSFFGLIVLIEGISSGLGIPSHASIPFLKDNSRDKIIESLTELENKIDELFNHFINAREKIIL